MTAREEMEQAAERYRDADWNVWSVRTKAQPGDAFTFLFTNSARRKAYEAWIAAVIRFNRERMWGQEAA